MADKKPFARGDAVMVRVKSPGGLITEHEARVKEMAGARDVAIELYGRDRIVKVSDVRRIGDSEELSQAAPVPQNGAVLSASLGERIMAKTTKPPAHFEPVKNVDPKDINVCMRGMRASRNITIELMAQMLRVTTTELAQLEAGEVIPDDAIVLRLADVLNVPIDALSAALDHTRGKMAKAKSDAEAAMRKLDDARKTAEEAAQSKPPGEAKRTLEEFAERLMDYCPVPIQPTARKQWWVFARGLFDLEGT